MAVKSSRDELHKLFQQRTGFTEAPIDYTKYSNKQVSTSRQLSARQQQDEYRIAMRRLGYEFSTDSTYKPEDGEERLSPSYTFTTGQQREAQTSIKELMEKYRQQDEYRKESRELQPLDRTALMPKDTAGLSPEILRSEVASGVRDWQAYDLAKKELDAKYPDRIYRPEEPKPIINAKVPKPQELKSKIDSAMTDTATGKTKEVVKEEVMKIFGIPIKPIWKVTTQDLKNDAQYMGASVTREVGRVAGALTPQAIANSAFLLSSYTANAPYNFLASRFGWKKLENKTLTKAITDVVQSAGVAPIPTANIENQTVKNIVNDINNGVDIIEGLNKRSMQYFGAKADEVALFVSKPMKIATSVVQTVPQMALMALPQGQLVYSLSTLNSALQEATRNGTISEKDMGYALSTASIEIVSELIFGLFGNAEALFPGALSALNLKAGAPTVYQLIKGVALQGFEESLEEIIAYPFQAFIDWRYKHPEQTLSEFATWEKAQEWGEAGLVGFLAGALMSTPTAIRMGKMTRQEAIDLQSEADDFLNSTASQLDSAKVLEFAEKVADNVPPTEAKATEAMLSEPAPDTTEDFDAVLQKDISQLKEKMTRLSELMKPAEAPTRPSERVQEPDVSVPSEEPVTPPAQSQDATQAQEAPVVEAKQEAKTVEPYQKTYAEYVKDSPREKRKADLLKNIEQAVSSIGAEKLISNNIMQAGQTIEEFANSIATQTSKWAGNRKERPTAIQMLSVKNLWGENAEPLRKALLNYTKSSRNGFLEKGEQHPRYAHKESVSVALKEGRKVPANVLAEYPDLTAEATSEQAPAEEGKISLDKAEVISDKSSTGKVYRIGDKVYKSGLFVGLPGRRIPNGRPTIEAQVYEELKNSDAIGRGRSVEIDGKPYIELPYYERVISTDEVPKADRDMYEPIITENMDRIIQSVQDLSNAGYDYGDPLQFGYDGDKMYLIDFSNTSKGEPNEVLNDNYNRLSNFFKEFGFERMDYIVSRGMQLRRNLESLVYEDVDKEDYNVLLKFTPEEIRGTVDELKRSSGDMQPNNVYYATNGRGIQIGNIMQTDRINGVKHIFSETPLDPKVVADWEMKPIYVGSVPSTNPKVKEQKKARLQSKAKANAHPVAKPVKKEAPKAKKKRQYYSMLTSADGKPTPSPVDGKAIKIDGLPNTELFIRRVDYGKKKSWSIVEASSGVALVDRQLTRKSAIDEANSVVERLGEDKILEKVNEAVQKYGSMPVEYTDEIQDVQRQQEKPKEPPKITYVHGKTAADFVAKPEPKAEAKPEAKPRAQAEEVAKEPTLTVSMQDLMDKYASGATREELVKDIDRWLDSDDADNKDIKSIKSESELGRKLLELKIEAETSDLDEKEYMRIDLQLLGLDAWGRRLENIPKGSAITEHMRKLVELFRSGSSQKVKNEINKIVDNNMLFHQIIADKAVIDEATANMQYGDEEYKIAFRKELIRKFTTHDVLTRAELVMGDMYAIELQQEDNLADAIAVSDIVSQRMGEIGGQLRAGLISSRLHGFSGARRLIADFNAQVDPLAKGKVENAGKETANIINKAKDDSIRDAAKDFVSTGVDETIKDADKTRQDVERKMDEKKAIRDGARKMQEEIDKPPAEPTDFDGSTEDEADLAQALADMIERYETQEPKESEGMTEAERLLHNLMVKYKERNPKYKVNLKPSPFAVLTDIIKNKDQYAEVWEGAQAIFKESAQGMDESLDWLNRFIDSFISPTHAVSADKFMRSVLRAQLKRMNISIADLALEFSKSPDVTISRFFTELRKSLSVLTDAEFAYVQKYMQDYMTQTMTEMNEKRKAKLREVKDARKQKPRKLKNEVDEQLANMIANNIRLHNKTEAPKVRTAEEKLISALYKKHTDYFGKKKKTPANIFDMLADIVTDRQAYEHIWFSARSLLQSYPDLAFSDVYTVMQNFNNPIVAESIIRGVVAQIVKENGKTFTETARDYYFNQNTTFKNFFTVLRGKIPDLGDADVKYLYDLFRPYFDKAMNDKRNQVRESLQRQVQRRKKIVETKGALQHTIDRMMDIAFRDELSIPELNSLWADRMGLPYLNEEMKKDIYDTMLKVHGITDSDAISDEIYSLQKRLAENTPSDYVDKVLAWMRFAMLMNPTTLLTNGMSNMAMYPMYNMSDRVQYVVEKVLRIPAEDRISGRDVIKVENTTEIGRVVLQHSTQEKIERHLAKSEKWDLQRVMNVERQYFKNKKIDSLVKSVGRAMNFGEIGKLKISFLGDNKPYTMHFRRSMANTLSAMGYNEGLPEAQKTDMIRKAMDKAANVAAVRTFRQKLAIAKMITGLAKPAYTKKQIREASPEEAARMRYTNQRIRLFARLTFPFVVTPVALTAETYKFSPYAGIVAALELATRGAISIKTKQPISTETKKRIARQLSQSAIGTTVMYALGWLLSALGYLDTDEPEAQRDANAWLLEGRQRYSIRIPGIGSVSLGWLQPLATAMFVGANHQKTIQSDGFDLYALLKSSADTIIKATILRDIFNPFNAGSYWEPSDQAEDYVTNAIFMAFPNVIRKFNKVVDPYQREIYGGTGWENLKNKFLSYVPFGSFAIPPEIDMFGNKVKPLRTGGVLGVAERTFLTFATPFTVRRKSPDVVADEILKVYKESKSLDAIPSFPGKEIADKKLNREEYTWYIKESGQIMYDAVQQVMKGGSVLGIKGSEKYNYETAEEQAKILKKIYDKARSMARDKWKTMGSKLPEE